MVHIVSVIPVSGGWAVTTRSLAGAMVFLSGGKAEAAARRLAETIARRGETVEIRIYLRDGSLAGRFVCAPMAELPMAG
jgi:hypothetical protein